MIKKAAAYIAEPRSRHALTYAVLIALFLCVLLLKNYFSMLVVSGILAFLFFPLYKKLSRGKRSDGRAAGLTLIIAILVIVLPLAGIVAVTVAQASTIVNDLSDVVETTDIVAYPDQALIRINEALSNLTGRTVEITPQQVQDKLAGYASTLANFVLDTLTSWIGSIGSFVTNAIIFMYVFTGILVHHKKLLELLGHLNPLGKQTSDLYVYQTGAMTKAMVRGQFIIAVLQGLVGALSLYIAGVPYFAFFALILSFLSLIPLGGGILTIPIGIIKLLMGDIWQGLFILLTHFLVVTNIDNILKPKLVPKSVRLHPALTLLAVFGGISLFGFLGIVVGPVLMILIITTINTYIQSTRPRNDIVIDEAATS